MQFVLRPFVGLEGSCHARQCDKRAAYKVWLAHSEWEQVMIGVICEEHSEDLKKLFLVTKETITKVEYT